MVLRASFVTNRTSSSSVSDNTALATIRLHGNRDTGRSKNTTKGKIQKEKYYKNSGIATPCNDIACLPWVDTSLDRSRDV